MKYYRKSVPMTPIYLSNGMRIRFETNDRETGYFATDNTWMQDQFAMVIARNQGGLVEIQQPEYEENFVKKKGIVFPKPSPIQELRAGNPPDTSTLHQTPSAVADINPSIPLIAEAKKIPEVDNSANMPIPQPKVGKRRGRPRIAGPLTE